MTMMALICLIGMFSPFPLFSVSHEGIRTYSLFGLFGSKLTPWSEVTTIRIEMFMFWPRTLKISSLNKPPSSRFAFVRWLNRNIPTRVRVSVIRGMTTMLMDELVDYILTQYEGEIQRYGIQVDVRGDE